MDFTALKAYIDDLHQQQGVPGCDIIVYRHGQPVYRYTTGDVNEQTLYNLYSCSKPITVTAALQLVEQGRLHLDDPVATYLPEYANAFVEEEGQRVPVGHTMTVRHLFTMTAGLTYQLDTPSLQALRRETPDATTRQAVAAFVGEPLLFRPGTRFNYSLCHDVLAAVVEVASGQRFGEYLQQHIFTPLGMTEIGLHPTAAQQARMATQYTVNEEKQVVSMEDNTIGLFRITSHYESGGAGLFADTATYGRFAAAMSCGGAAPDGTRILFPETVDLMRSEQLAGYVRNDAFGCAAGPGYGYGLGVRTLVDRSAGQRSSLGEFGWDGAAGAYILMDPSTEVGIVYMQQVRNWPARFGCMHAPIRDFVYEALSL